MSGVPADTQHIAGWQRLFDHTYEQSSEAEAAFDITGWNSSYSGQPIPEQEMWEWVQGTVERIALRGGQRVLEIGCGTGLLLARLAQNCEVYTATDFSSVALDHVRRLMSQRVDLRHVELLERSAENFEGIARAGYDTVILNSVVQYFPSIEYLRNVLDGALAVLEPGGRIFLGDVRSLPLLRALHASIRCHRESPQTRRAQLSRLVDHDVENESELVVDPAFFASLAAEDQRIHDAEILMKRGSFQNELTRFRYDVWLSSPATERIGLPDTWLDWEQDRLTVADLEKRLAVRPPLLAVRGVPNARLASTVFALDWLGGEGEGVDSLGQYRAAERSSGEYVEPEALWSVAESSGYVLECSDAADGTIGRFDALFVDPSLAGRPRKVLWGRTSSAAPQPRETYANMPARTRLARELTPVPAARVLQPSAQTREARDIELPGPSDSLETQLASIWARVLGGDSVGVHDDFFDLGGDSFMATRLVSLIQAELGWKTSVMELFAHPTIEELAKLAEAAQV